MTDYPSMTEWLKAQADFTTKKRLMVFTDIIHTPSGEKVTEGFRYFTNPIAELLAAFETGDIAALQSLDYALDEDGDVDTTSVCVLLAYTKGGAFVAAQVEEHQDYVPTLLSAPKYLNAAPNLGSLVRELDQCV